MIDQLHMPVTNLTLTIGFKLEFVKYKIHVKLKSDISALNWNYRDTNRNVDKVLPKKFKPPSPQDTPISCPYNNKMVNTLNEAVH